MSRISQILDDIEATLAFPIARGQRELYSTHDTPRVVAHPIGGPVVPSDRIGGQPLGVGKARQVLTRQCGVKFYCWHQTESDAEDLLHSTLAAVRKSCHNSVTFADEVWEDQAEDQDGFQREGTMISFTATISIPVFDVVFPVHGPVLHDHSTAFGAAIYGTNTYGNCTFGAAELFEECA